MENDTVLQQQLNELRSTREKYLKEENWHGAMKILEKMIKLKPTPNRYYKMGLLLRKNKFYTEALENFQIALQLKPNFENAQKAIEKLKLKLPESKAGLQPGQMFEHYKIKKKLGEGGMGAVYKAYDTKLERDVALKIILPGHDIMRAVVKRFIQEAKAMAKVKHPNIVNIFEVGNLSQNYFTMEYIEGETLAHKIAENKASIENVAAWIERVAFALHTAHKSGIIHRDIKPSNIIIDKDNQPKILDFGLAKVSSSRHSQTGEMWGTPAYMPPEQMCGREVDARSDVYSLGITLYESLTGKPPFLGDSYQILQQVMKTDPAPIGKINSKISKELEAICLKSIEKKPRNRYNDALEFARDLKNYRNDKPIIAKPATGITKARKFIVRNKKLLSGVVIGTTIALILHFVFAAFSQLISIPTEKRPRLAQNPNTAPKILAKLAKDTNSVIRIYIASNPATPRKILKRLAKDDDFKVRAAVASNENVLGHLLVKLAKDEHDRVRECVAGNWHLPVRLFQRLARDSSAYVRAEIAINPYTPEKLLSYLAGDKDEKVRAEIAYNEKTPAHTLKMLAMDKNLQVLMNVARNYNTPEKILREMYEKHKNNRSILSCFPQNPSIPVSILSEMLKKFNGEIKYLLLRNKCFKDLQAYMKDKDTFGKLGIINNPNVTPEMLVIFSKDKNTSIRRNVAYNVKTPEKTLNALAYDSQAVVRAIVAGNKNTNNKTLRILLMDEDVIVRITNPKIPQRQLRKYARSRNIEYRTYAALNPALPLYFQKKLLQDRNSAVRVTAIQNHSIPSRLLRKVVHNKEERMIIRDLARSILYERKHE